MTDHGLGYRAAENGAAVCSRPHRRFLGVSGRSPREMLNGLLSNRPPPPLQGGPDGTWKGSAVYSTLLTDKGRIITDLRILRDAKDGFLLDLPSDGFEGAVAHFRKFLPPRLAKVEDRSEGFGQITVLGPEAGGMLSEFLATCGWALSPGELADLAEGDEIGVTLPSSPNREEGRVGAATEGDGSRTPETVRVMGNGETAHPGFDLLLSPYRAEEARRRLARSGAAPLGEADLETLRIENGRPAFGKDLTEETIPLEAGIQDRAIDNEKGCYAGQEVIIRIRDRGHVNKKFRGILLGDIPAPASGEELFLPGKEKSVGWITSAVGSPAFGQAIALGYLRRGVEPGDDVRVGGPDGLPGQVRALSDRGWVLD
ncbi:MAG: folate-binding protein YgfZ [Gemmatimonadetes bacterium]|nr:hypothetical protein [Gemmatimonadota bacterium]NNM06758.1 folate-binding protein YgfZ [Gemmatimonadota bacterium]